MIKKVLCVCLGNGDRSPFMTAVLRMYLENAGKNGVICTSAGVLEIAGKGGRASTLMRKVARRIGLDLSSHERRWIDSLDVSKYDLFVCVDDMVAAHVLGLGVDIKKVCNVQVDNCWPSQFQRDLDDTAERIMGAMLRVVSRYFSGE